MNKADKLTSYQNKWGKKGTYWIYEEEAPRGFLEDGRMSAVDDCTNEVASDVRNGFVVFMNPSSDPDRSVLKVNGSKTDKSIDVIAGKQPNASVVAEEQADTMDIVSSAENIDTGNQYAKPGVITIKDDIIITPMTTIPNAEYYITTQVLDKDTGEFLDVSWDESVTMVKDSDDVSLTFSTNVTPVDPDERYKMFGSSITTKTDSPKVWEDGFNTIWLEVQGTVDASGLTGHN